MSAQVIGYLGENGARDVRIPIGHLLDKWQGLRPLLVMVPVGGSDDEAYPVQYTLEGTDLVWHVSDADTAVAGTTKAAVRMVDDGGRVGMDEPFQVIISPNLSAGGEPPVVIKPWVDKLATLVPRAEAAAERAENAAQNWETGTAPNALALGGKPPEYYLPAVNLLDNSDWRVKDRIINQRGETAYSGIRKYTIDRWYIYKNSTTDGILTIENNGISVDGFLYQLLDINKIKENTVYTLAIKKTDEDFFIYSSTFENSTGSTTFYFSGNYAVVRIASGSYLWAALYEGVYTADTLPPYVPKGYAAELAECMRYVVGATSERDMAVVLDNGSFTISIPTPVTMRDGVTTSMAQNPAGNLQVYVGGSWEEIPLTAFTVRKHQTHVILQAAASNLGTTGTLERNNLYLIQYLPFLIADL